MNKIVLALALLFVIQCASAFEWTSCGSATDDFKITQLSIKPDPPVRGQNTSVLAVGTMDKQITSGTSTLIVKLGVIVVLKQVESICTAPVTCPIPAGPFNGALPPVLLPADAPNGNYVGNVKITDQTGAELACVNYSFTVSN